jgi:hypothetical protein
MTAERKKAKYTYYRCTGFHGRCGNEYIREERLADLLGGVVQRIQIPGDVADSIAEHLRDGQTETEQARQRSVSQLTQRQRAVQVKLDRGYEDYLEGRISESFWTRKSQEWEMESATIESEIARLSHPTPGIVATGEKILELVKQAEFLYKTQSRTEQRRLLETVLSNCTFDRGSLCPTYSKPFDLLVRGNETGCWRGRRSSPGILCIRPQSWRHVGDGGSLDKAKPGPADLHGRGRAVPRTIRRCASNSFQPRFETRAPSLFSKRETRNARPRLQPGDRSRG